jgi:hypothetical protein
LLVPNGDVNVPAVSVTPVPTTRLARSSCSATASVSASSRLPAIVDELTEFGIDSVFTVESLDT